MWGSILALSPQDLLPSVYLATNRIAPDFEKAELNVGGATVAGAVAEVTGVSRQRLRELYTASGDLGDAAQLCRARQRLLVQPKALTVQHVYAALWKLNRATGQGSGARKKDIVAALLRRYCIGGGAEGGVDLMQWKHLMQDLMHCPHGGTQEGRRGGTPEKVLYLPPLPHCSSGRAEEHDNEDLMRLMQDLMHCLSGSTQGVQALEQGQGQQIQGGIGRSGRFSLESAALALALTLALALVLVLGGRCSLESVVLVLALALALVLVLAGRCREMETRYLVRTLVQNMRIGAMMRTVLPALSNAVLLERVAPGAQVAASEYARLKPRLAGQAGALGECYNAMPDLGALLPLLLDPEVSLEGIVERGQFIRPGTPLKPMLAKVARTAEGVVDHFGGCAFCCEYKYDGRRAQIHVLKGGSQVRIFSRTSDDCSAAFPDAAAAVLRAMRPHPASAEQGLASEDAGCPGGQEDLRVGWQGEAGAICPGGTVGEGCQGVEAVGEGCEDVEAVGGCQGEAGEEAVRLEGRGGAGTVGASQGGGDEELILDAEVRVWW